LVVLLAAQLRGRGFLVIEEHVHAHLPRIVHVGDKTPAAA